MKNNQSVAVLLMAGGLVLSSATGAATLAQMQQLDAATPPGSRIVCERNHPARDAATPAYRELITGVVTARQGHRTEYQVELAVYPSGSNTPFSLIRFTQAVTLGEDAQTVTIDPASLSVSLHGATADEERQLFESIRRDQPATSQDPYSQTEFTTFPDYVVNEPGIPTGYCRVKTTDRA